MKYALILTILLAGCSTTAIFEDEDGKQWTSAIKGIGKSTVKTKDGMEMSIEGKPLVEFPRLPDIEIDN